MNKYYFVSLLIFSTFVNANEGIVKLVDACAPQSHKQLILKIIEIESRGNPTAININGSSQSYLTLRSPEKAISLIEEALLKELSVDIGLTQINSQHFQKGRVFAKRGFIELDALDACTNIKMASFLLSDAYRRYDGDILATLSVYNTGSPTKGFTNGYLDKYFE